jgi:hypothetical protein
MACEQDGPVTLRFGSFKMLQPFNVDYVCEVFGSYLIKVAKLAQKSSKVCKAAA